MKPQLSRYLTTLLLVLLLSSLSGRALGVPTGMTRPWNQPGAPAGSFALSGFEHVNAFTGHLNFSLPFLNIGGRGSAGAAMFLRIERSWRNIPYSYTNWSTQAVYSSQQIVCYYSSEADDGSIAVSGCYDLTMQGVTTPPPQQPVVTQNTPAVADSQVIDPGYGPGVLIQRTVIGGSKTCLQYAGGGAYTQWGSAPWWTKSYLTFISPDGTEHELVDQQTYGTFRENTNTSCSPPPAFSRGTAFVSTDGSAMTFIADSALTDGWVQPDNFTEHVGTPSGYLLMSDGTRYRINNGTVASIRDRNGNLTEFTYETTTSVNKRVTAITDSLGRRVNVYYDVNDATISPDGTPYGLCDQIVYQGYGGAGRTIRITKTSLSNVLRPNSGYSIRTGYQLWPVFNPSSSAQSDVNPPNIVSAIWLPDGRAYRFFYNPFVELARVELPTGGAIDYNYDYGYTYVDSNGATSHITASKLYRRLVDRRVYTAKTDPYSLTNKTTYSQIYPTRYWYNNTALPDVKPVVVEQKDKDGNRISRAKHYFYGDPLDGIKYAPGGAHLPITAADWKNGREVQTDFFGDDGETVLRRISYNWQPRVPEQGYDQSYTPARDPLLLETTTTIEPTGANLVTKQSAINPQTGAWGFDQYNNQTDVYEYDFGPGAPAALKRQTHTDYKTDALYVDAQAGAHIRNLPTARVMKDGAGNVVAQSATRYDEAALDSCSGIFNWADPGTSARGNPTTTSRWLNTSNTWIETHAGYDQAGNVVRAQDALNHTTTIGYTDSFANGAHCTLPNGSTCYTYAFPTSTTAPIPDPNNTGYGSTTALLTTSVYDYWSGHVTSETDANGQVTTADYTDPLDRLKQVNSPDGGRTTYTYVDTHQCGPYVETRTLLDSSGRELAAFQFFDGLGRGVRAFQYEGQDVNNLYLTADTQYDALGRVAKVSNSYRSSGCTAAVNPAGNWTTTTYDALGRVTTVKTPDNAQVTTTYGGNQVTVTDQAGKVRSSVSDALGRVTSVTEAPGVMGYGFVTSYAYDTLGNLRKVEQGGQTRYFMYDSLSRLIRARNPEQVVNTGLALQDTFKAPEDAAPNSQWTLAYAYDQNGNLMQKTDARGVIASYGYDALNRNTTVTYTNDPANTPAVEHYYDGATTNGKGRLWYSATLGPNASVTVVDQYDAAGRPLLQWQRFATAGDMGNGVFWRNQWWSPAYKVSRAYDLAGHVAAQIYPSGHAVAYSYDAAGRLGDNGASLAFTGNLGDGVARTYASALSYDEAGRLREERYGTQTPLYHKLHYNSRGQLYDIRLSTISWQADPLNWNRGCLALYYDSGYHWGGGGGQDSGPDNNGNVLRAQNWVPGDDQISSYQLWDDFYSYDALNRLTQMQMNHSGSPTIQQVYQYDRWGNRTIDTSLTTAGVGINNLGASADATTNRLYAPGDLNITNPDQRRMRYDFAGNLTYDAYYNNQTQDYDAENRMTGAVNQYTTSAYVYDADGRRVRRTAWGQQTWQVYGMDGELLSEYVAGSATFVPAKEYGYRGGQLLVTMAGGDDQRLLKFVHKLYDGALGRGPNSAEQQQGMATLTAAGSQGQAQLLAAAQALASALFTSGEYAGRNRTDAQYVTDLYWTYPQRIPDAGGYQAWLNYLTANPTQRALARDGFAYSAEFQALVSRLYGQATTDAQRTQLFVYRLYSPLPGRPTGGELADKTALLDAAAAQGQSQVVAQAQAVGRTVFTSQDYLNLNRSARDYVSDLYLALLGRAPDAYGWDAWTNAAAAYGRAAVLEGFLGSGEFQYLAGTLYRETFWLTPDHLGTPRMVNDKTGSLAGVKRHDYLPFGEELQAGTGGRTTAQGYGQVDNTRQKFTGYERDNETGLDYAQARYYASTQGRFTSVDPLMVSAKAGQPQSWNRYSYTFNNPVNLIDPDGRSATPDDYYIERNGNITVDQTSDSFDRFYVEQRCGEQTLVAKLEKNDAGLVAFPSSGTGFNRYGTEDAGGTDKRTGENVGTGDHYLKPEVAAALFGVINVLNTDHGLTLSLGDMSSSNGSDPWAVGQSHHAGHGHNGNRSGLDADFRYLNGDGVSFQSPTARSDSQFSLANNQTVFDTAARFGFTTNYQGKEAGSNGELKGVTKAGGHNDHGHLGFTSSACITIRTRLR